MIEQIATTTFYVATRKHRDRVESSK